MIVTMWLYTVYSPRLGGQAWRWRCNGCWRFNTFLTIQEMIRDASKHGRECVGPYLNPMHPPAGSDTEIGTITVYR